MRGRLFLERLDDLTVKENFLPNVGPAMLHTDEGVGTKGVPTVTIATSARVRQRAGANTSYAESTD